MANGGRRLKFAVAGGALIVAVIVLVVIATGRSTTYYYTVGELVDKGAAKGVRAAGQLVSGSLELSSPPGGTATFRLQDPGAPEHSFSVTYTGALPDTFKEGMTGDVVVEGDYDGSGLFSAASILTKCPSKYERATEEKVRQLQDGSGGY